VIRRIVLLYRLEVVKSLHRRQTFIAPVLLSAVIALAPLVHPVERDGMDDYGFIAYVTPLSLNFLGYLLLLTFSASLIAGETEHGAIRPVLLRPLTRTEFLSAKLLLGFSYAVLLTMIVVTMSWAIAWSRGDLLGVHLGGELIYTAEEMFRSYAATRSSSTAISLTLGTWIVVDLIKYPLGISPLVFTTYLEAPWQVFSGRCDALDYSWWPMAWQCALCSVVVMILATGLALTIFNRRNLGGC
jgi:hypothetical protein